MALFQTKIVWKRRRMRENKNYCFVPFLTGAEQKMPKKKRKKIKKIPLWHHFKPKQFGKGQEREKIKIILSFRSQLTRYGKFQKNSNEIQKIKKKYRYGFISSQNRLKEDEKERK